MNSHQLQTLQILYRMIDVGFLCMVTMGITVITVSGMIVSFIFIYIYMGMNDLFLGESNIIVLLTSAFTMVLSCAKIIPYNIILISHFCKTVEKHSKQEVHFQ